MSVLPPRYADVRLLGSGGMAEVFAAHDELVDRDVAVKVLAKRHCRDDYLRVRFRQEATLAAALGGHPHVVTVHDVGEWEGRPYIVMELATGGSLADRVAAGPTDRRWALVWLAQAADALDSAHARGIVHRDVKPANLLVDEYGAVRIADFGVARAPDRTLTATGELLGTMGYFSPEHARAEECTPASDRYALGVVARELLTGKRNGTLPPAVEPVLARATAKDPGERYASATEFVAALRAALAEPVPVSAAAPQASGAPRKVHRAPARLRRAIVVTGIAVGAAAVATASTLATRGVMLSNQDRAALKAPRRPTTCTASVIGHDANVVVRGVRSAAYCNRLTRRLTTEDGVWAYRTGRSIAAPDHGEVSFVCRFRDGTMQLAVYDSGSQSIGRSVCWTYRAGGWRAGSTA